MNNYNLEFKIEEINSILNNNKIQNDIEIGKIYEIIGYGLRYIGCTIQSLKSRTLSHIQSYNKYIKSDKRKLYCKSVIILDKGNEWSVNLIDIIPVYNNNFKELYELEKKYINDINCINNDDMDDDVDDDDVDDDDVDDDDVDDLDGDTKIDNSQINVDIGTIYKIYNDTDIYYGSTIGKLDYRIKKHLLNLSDGNRKTTSMIIMMADNWNYKPEEYLLVYNLNRTALRQIENKYINENNCVNKCNSFRSKEEKKEYLKTYYKQNKQVLLQKNREYVLKFMEKTRDYQRKWKESHKEKMRIYFRMRHQNKKNEPEYVEARRSYKKTYNQRPEVINKNNAYNQRPDVKERRKQQYLEKKTSILNKQKEKIKCDICNKELNRGSLSKHMKNMHNNN